MGQSKIKSILKRIQVFLFTWGKPIVAKLLREKLKPLLQDEINAGAIDEHVDAALGVGIDKFCEKYLNSPTK